MVSPPWKCARTVAVMSVLSWYVVPEKTRLAAISRRGTVPSVSNTSERICNKLR